MSVRRSYVGASSSPSTAFCSTITRPSARVIVTVVSSSTTDTKNESPSAPSAPSAPSLPLVPFTPSFPSLPSTPSLPSLPSAPSLPFAPSLPSLPLAPFLIVTVLPSLNVRTTPSAVCSVEMITLPLFRASIRAESVAISCLFCSVCCFTSSIASQS